MKILFLCKRRPMGRDLVSRPYGRFFHLPYYLAKCGHEVYILLLDYSGGKPLELDAHGMHWESVPLTLRRPGLYVSRINQLVEEFRPDWLIGLSDTYYGILAQRIGKQRGTLTALDAYDNYESYIPWLKPLHWLWRSALCKADLVTAAGPGLLALMAAGRRGKSSAVVPMAPDPIGFKPLDREVCRRQFGLPTDSPLIGYCGSLHKNRGVEVLFAAIEKLQEHVPDIILVHSGRILMNLRLPAFVRSLGYIEDQKMPALLNSMNILTVINRDSAFGNHSYPVKLYEAMNCGVPVVASRTPATEWILGPASDCLVAPDDPAALSQGLARSLQVAAPVDYGVIPDWEASGKRLEEALRAYKPAGITADTVSQ